MRLEIAFGWRGILYNLRIVRFRRQDSCSFHLSYFYGNNFGDTTTTTTTTTFGDLKATR